MKRVMLVVNNEILARKNADTYNIVVRDKNRLRNRRKKCYVSYDGVNFRVIKSDYPVERTNDMLHDVKNNMKFIAKVL